MFSDSSGCYGTFLLKSNGLCRMIIVSVLLILQLFQLALLQLPPPLSVEVSFDGPDGAQPLDYVLVDDTLYVLYHDGEVYRSQTVTSLLSNTSFALFRQSSGAATAFDVHSGKMAVGFNGYVTITDIYSQNDIRNVTLESSSTVACIRLHGDNLFVSQLTDIKIYQYSVSSGTLIKSFSVNPGRSALALKFELERSRNMIFIHGVADGPDMVNSVFTYDYSNGGLIGLTQGTSFNKRIYQIYLDRGTSTLYGATDDNGIKSASLNPPVSSANNLGGAGTAFVGVAASYSFMVAITANGVAYAWNPSGVQVMQVNTYATSEKYYALNDTTNYNLAALFTNRAVQIIGSKIFMMFPDNQIRQISGPLAIDMIPVGISQVYPSVLSTSGNELITFEFYPNPKIIFGTLQVTIDGNECTSVNFNILLRTATCYSPAGLAAYAPVNLQFSEMGPITKTFLSYKSPAVLSVSPQNGLTSGNTNLTLQTSDIGLLTDGIRVELRQIAPPFFVMNCQSAIRVDASTVTCLTPSVNYPETFNVYIEVTSGSLSRRSSDVIPFKFGPPSITSVSPSNTAASIGGDLLNITGASFGSCGANCPQMQVTIGTSPCQRPNVISHSLLQCSAPPGVGKDLPVTFSINGVSSTLSNGFSYAKPQITSINPLKKLIQPGDWIDIFGANFGPFDAEMPTVYFAPSSGDTWLTCDQVQRNYDSQVRCQLNALDPGSYSVYVSVGGQVSASESSVFMSMFPNRAPVANNVTALGYQNDDSVIIQFDATDPDEDNVRYMVESLPKRGKLYEYSPNTVKGPEILGPREVPGNSVVYTPQRNYNGGDGFSYKARDQQPLFSEPVLAEIHIAFVNQPPYLDQTEITVAGMEDAVSDFLVYANDIDDYLLTCFLTSVTSVGNLTWEGAVITSEMLPYNLTNPGTMYLFGTVTYVPKPLTDGNNVDSFTYNCMDSVGQTMLSDVTVKINLASVNHAPTAAQIEVELPQVGEGESGFIVIVFEGADVDAESLTYVVKSLPTNGVLYSLTKSGVKSFPVAEGQEFPPTVNQNVRFEPNTNFHGTDSFIYSAIDSALALSNDAAVTINVTPVNQRPTMVRPTSNVACDESASVDFSLTATDVENDEMSFSILELPVKGVLFDQSGTEITSVGQILGKSSNEILITYTPSEGYGLNYDSFKWTATDSQGLSFKTTATVTFDVNPVNHAPTAQNSTVDAVEDAGVIITLRADDQDLKYAQKQEELTYIIKEVPKSGSLTEVDPVTGLGTQSSIGKNSFVDSSTIYYTPAADFNGVDEIWFVVRDAAGSESGMAKVDITVSSINDLPELFPKQISLVIKPDTDILELRATVEDKDMNSPYVISFNDPPTRGLWYTSPDSDKPLSFGPDEIISTIENSSFTLYVRHDGKMGGTPYTAASIAVTDALGGRSSSLAKVEITVECPPTLYINVFNTENPSVCATCPVGGICSPSGAFLPFNQAGYYQVSTTVFLPCEPSSACKEGTPRQGVSLEFASSESVCASGYNGTRCGECTQGYYRGGSYCQKCPENLNPFVLALIIFVVIIAALAAINFIRKVDVGFVGVFINFVQTVSILQEFGIEWPINLTSFLRALSILNLNIEITSPECFVGKSDDAYELKYYGMMSLPLIVLGICILMVLCHYLISKFNTSILKRVPEKDDFNKVSIKKSVLLNNPLQSNNGLEKGEENMEDYANLNPAMIPFYGSMAAVYILFLKIYYLAVTTTTLKLFDCTTRQDGKSYFDAVPSRLCYQEWWQRLLPFSIFGIVCYVIGIPLLIFTLHYYKMKIDPNEKTSFVQRLVLYATYEKKQQYKKEHGYWDVVLLARKFAVVVSQLFFTAYISVQVIFLLMVFNAFIIQHVDAKPYVISSLNKLETACMFGINFVMLSGMLFYVNKLNPVINAELLGAFVIAAIAICISSVILLFLHYTHAPMVEFIFGKSKDNNEEKFQ